MRYHGIPDDVTQWYYGVPQGQSATAASHGITLTVTTTMGTPQGGVLSPNVWNLLVAEPLVHFHGDAVNAIDDANYVLFIILRPDIFTMTSLMQAALNGGISAWPVFQSCRDTDSGLHKQVRICPFPTS